MSYDVYAYESQSSGKSVLLAFVLTFFFGPFGMLYSTVVGGLIMLVVCLFFGAITLGFGLIVLWPICIIWGTVAAACSGGSTGGGRQRHGRWNEEADEPTAWERSRRRRRYAAARDEDDWDDEYVN